MVFVIFLVSLFSLLFTGIPIAFVLMISAIVMMRYMGFDDPMILAQQMVDGTSNYILTAIPFFILAGEVMYHGGISKRLVRFAELVVGRARGGLGYVTILASILFAGLSGVAIADVSALGSILIPMMVEAGYRKDRSTGLICASSLLAPIIPPSLPLIVLGVTVELSIGKLFMAGIFPGLFLAICLMITWFFVVRRDGYTQAATVSREHVLPIILNAVPAMMMPLIIIVGIRFGYFTPTEGGAIAAVYALVISLFLHREMPARIIIDVLYNAAKGTAAVMFIVTTAYTIGWLITIAQVPQQIISRFQGLTGSPITLLLTINVMLLLLGMVMDLTPIILIFAPVIYPLILAAKIDPYYFAIVMVLNLVIGLLTPPVGTALYVGCSVSNLKIGDILRGIWPFLIVEVLVLLLFIMVPQLITVPLSYIY
ncbi:MAG: TRAP transporter large permease [Planctomycetes bacterium]|nr:TRAP transporter large permease [Planctomycetota bacterium]